MGTGEGAAAQGGPAPVTSIDGRRLRRDRNRDAVVTAALELYREGAASPSIEEIAARAGLSARSVYRYFDDLDALAHAAVARQQDHLAPLHAMDVDAGGPLEERIDGFVAARVRLLEGMGPVGRIARAAATRSEVVADELRRLRTELRAQSDEVFAAELDDVAAPVRAAVDAATSWEAHFLLRSDQGATVEEAAAAMTVALQALLERGR